ncbi:MAG TPA: hypothetical protein VF654_10545, partial [Pyrinomonadaceae bacterium]
WFLCIAPLDRPQLAIAVIIEGGGYGAKAAAPVAAALVLKARDLGLLAGPGVAPQPQQPQGQRPAQGQPQPAAQQPAPAGQQPPQPRSTPGARATPAARPRAGAANQANQ